MTTTITGTLHKKIAEQKISDNFSIFKIVIEAKQASGKIHFPSIDFFNDENEMLSEFEEGDKVAVDFEVVGKEYIDKKTTETKYFNTLKGFHVELANDKQTQETEESSGSISSTSQEANVKEAIPVDSVEGEVDDLPF